MLVHGSISSREHVREGKERVEVVADKAARAGIHFQFSTQPRSRAREFARRWARACSRSRFLIATRPASPSPWAGRGSIYQVVPGRARVRAAAATTTTPADRRVISRRADGAELGERPGSASALRRAGRAEAAESCAPLLAGRGRGLGLVGPPGRLTRRHAHSLTPPLCRARGRAMRLLPSLIFFHVVLRR